MVNALLVRVGADMAGNVGSALAETEKPELAEHEQSAKRRQIMEGQAETVFSLDPADHEVEAVHTRLGRSFVKFLCRPGAMSTSFISSKAIYRAPSQRIKRP